MFDHGAMGDEVLKSTPRHDRPRLSGERYHRRVKRGWNCFLSSRPVLMMVASQSRYDARATSRVSELDEPIVGLRQRTLSGS
jgi:hypothetical protein